MSLIVLASVVLNFYWFYLMCKMIYRVLSRMVAPSKEEKVELIKMD